MRIALFLSLLLSTSTLFATVEARLPNNNFAYYGAEFYQNFPAKITKDGIFKILSGTHSSNPKGYDTIGACKAGTCYSHVSVGYTAARKILFGEIYVENDSKGKYIDDVYCDKKFYFRSVDEVGDMHTEVNIEHTWPQSKFTGRFAKDMQKSDMHHLYLTDSDANNQRGNHRFGNVSESEDELNVQNCTSSRLGHDDGKTIFNPPAKHLGNVARSLFYFATRYQMEIEASEEKVLREWHKKDPVNDDEKARHELIARHEQLRNPFVDHPELVDSIPNF